MSWVEKVITSEFLWGLVVGLVLAIVVARLTLWFDTRHRRKLVAELCADLIRSIGDLIQNLEDNRDRNRVIDHEFLDTILAELHVYGRNREHLILVSDPKLRSEIQEFFTRVAALLAKINWLLRRYYEIVNNSDSPHPESLLAEAHKACDRLREMKDRGDRLANRL